MNTQLKQWLPMALCCLPGVIVAAVISLILATGGVAFGSAGASPLGLGLLALAMLACPVGMGTMMRRQRHPAPGAAEDPATMAGNCCPPGSATDLADDRDTTRRLAALRERRKALERELALLSDKPQ